MLQMGSHDDLELSCAEMQHAFAIVIARCGSRVLCSVSQDRKSRQTVVDLSIAPARLSNALDT